MEINKEVQGKTYTLTLTGRLDTNTAPELEKELQDALSEADSLVFDMSGLTYISSAGLRVLLMGQKAMNARKGSMIVRKCCDAVLEVFDVTGFADILHIE